MCFGICRGACLNPKRCKNLMIMKFFYGNGYICNTACLYWKDALGPVSMFDRTSYCKISQSLEASRFVFRIVRSLWNLTAADVPVTFQRDAIIQTTNLAAPRIHEILLIDWSTSSVTSIDDNYKIDMHRPWTADVYTGIFVWACCSIWCGTIIPFVCDSLNCNYFYGGK